MGNKKGRPRRKREHLEFVEARRRLARANGSKSEVVGAIRDLFPACPAGSHARAIHWFIRRTASSQPPPSRTLDPNGADFLSSFAWRKVRMDVLERRGRRCECCGATPADGKTVVHVDHIKPRKFFPHLALDIDNLQVLCSECNHGKGNFYQTDWRSEVPADIPINPFKPRLVRKA